MTEGALLCRSAPSFFVSQQEISWLGRMSSATGNGRMLKMERREKDTLTEYVTFSCYELLELELKRAYRGKQSLSLLLISFLFPLKSGAGQLISILEGLLRDIDVVVRYSQHELLIILPMTGKDGALHVLEKVTKALDSLEYLTETSGYSRFVAAVAAFPEDAVNKKGLFVRLEQQLRQ
jgi:hypothetical protein